MRRHRPLALIVPRITIRPIVRAAPLLACLFGCLGTLAVASGQSASLAETTFAPPSATDAGEYEIIFSASEARLLALARRGEVDAQWLFEAALAADGISEPAALTGYRRRWQTWCGQLDAETKQARCDPERARAIFVLLHREALVGGYAADATGLQTALGGGGYNCVSATILFNSLAAAVGLNVAAIETPEHVYSVVRSSEGEFAVEMTCLRWFDLSADARREALGERSPSSGPRPSWSGTEVTSARRELSPAGLVALVYYNSGVDHLSRGAFRESLMANLKARAFDPANSLAHGNLLATLNNWALTRYEAGDYATAVRLIEYGRRLAPAHPPFEANLAAIYERWSEQFAGRRPHD